jgi:Ca-activated chloride channel family protein
MFLRPESFHKSSTGLALVTSFSFRSILVIAVFSVLQLFFPPSISTQVQEPGDEVLRVTTDLLLFPARIRDKDGKRPNGLTARDFSLKDPDGVTSGLYVSAGVDRLALVFVLDQSGSLRDLVNQQRDAALGLYERFSSNSSIAVVHFAEAPTIAAPFARSSAAARAAFDVAARPNQRTAIFDAAAKAVDMFGALPRVRTERRIVILISDGLDTASRTKASEVIDAAREKDVSFYLIHLRLFAIRDGRVVQRRPTKGFVELGLKTGGGYMYPGEWAFDSNKKVDLGPIFQMIESDLRSQYVIGFYLNEKANDGRRHNFSLTLPTGFEYQVGSRNYSRKQNFFVERPRDFLKNRN